MCTFHRSASRSLFFLLFSAIVASSLSSPTHSQVDIIAAYGERLLEWLQKYTFPAESKFAAASHATACADFFVKELLRNGTTCALAFCTVHPGSVDALLEKAADAGMMMICGKVMRCKVNTTRGVW